MRFTGKFPLSFFFIRLAMVEGARVFRYLGYALEIRRVVLSQCQIPATTFVRAGNPTPRWGAWFNKGQIPVARAEISWEGSDCTLCRTSAPRTQNMTSSAMLVA
jgi:hypothetical protein